MTTADTADVVHQVPPAPQRPGVARAGWWAGVLTTLTAATAWILVMVVPGAPPRPAPAPTARADRGPA